MVWPQPGLVAMVKKEGRGPKAEVGSRLWGKSVREQAAGGANGDRVRQKGMGGQGARFKLLDSPTACPSAALPTACPSATAFLTAVVRETNLR